MRVLVTGGCGFIGSHLVDKLLERGIDVRIFDLAGPPCQHDVEFFHGTLLDPAALRVAMGGVDVVMHLGAVADVKDVHDEPQYAEMINVRGTINVLEAARRMRVTRVIYGSTTWVYGDVDAEVVDESVPLQPPSHLYTATKIASEHYCQSYSTLYGLPFTILRYGIPYGPRARDGAVIPIFVQRALSGAPITIAGDGSQFRKFVYVEDLAVGNALALKPIAANRIYNLDGDCRVTIREIAETVREVIGDVQIEYGPARVGDFGGKDVISRRAQEELGWAPRVGLAEGIRRYVAWYRQREHERQAAWDRLDVGLKA